MTRGSTFIDEPYSTGAEGDFSLSKGPALSMRMGWCRSIVRVWRTGPEDVKVAVPLFRKDHIRMLRMCPSSALLISPAHSSSELMRYAGSHLAGAQYMVDLTDAYCVICAAGIHARDLLATGTFIDVESMKVGAHAATLFGHYAIIILKTAKEEFHLLVLQTLAASFWDALAHRAQEFGS